MTFETLTTLEELNTIDARIPTNRTYKDSLFRMIYSGKDERSKRWLLSLYNALSGKNHTDISELQITTIENVIYITMKNDLSFLIDSQMNLFEQQSTVNPNMPLRGLIYFGQLYQNEVKKQDKDIYGSKLIKIPSPKFIVFYNGNTELDDTLKYRLSDAFEFPDNSGEFEWTATVININKGHNQKSCKSLYHYCAFVNRVKENLKKKMAANDAINEAVDFAIKGNFLEGFFQEQKMNILTDLLTEFNQEDYDRHRRAEGAQQNAISNAKNMLKDNVLPEQVSKWTFLPLEQVLALKEELEHEAAALTR